MVDAMREAFEAIASDNGKYSRAIERDSKGDYVLMQTRQGWSWWQAAYKEFSKVTDDMVDRAEEAYMPFGDMRIALEVALCPATLNTMDCKGGE